MLLSCISGANLSAPGSRVAVLCPFRHLRELDLDGSFLTGPIPRWIADCFPHLKGVPLKWLSRPFCARF